MPKEFEKDQRINTNQYNIFIAHLYSNKITYDLAYDANFLGSNNFFRSKN